MRSLAVFRSEEASISTSAGNQHQGHLGHLSRTYTLLTWFQNGSNKHTLLSCLPDHCWGRDLGECGGQQAGGAQAGGASGAGSPLVQVSTCEWDAWSQCELTLLKLFLPSGIAP